MPLNKTNIFLIFIIISLIIGFIVWWVIKRIKENHLQDDPKLHHLREILHPVHPVVKDLKLYRGKKSYTLNKEKIYLCLVDENGEYYSNNQLLYVLLHEMAHLLNKDDIGHTEKFHKIFRELLDKAIELGIYDDSIPPIQDYCTYND
jgi:hypothetical protein